MKKFHHITIAPSLPASPEVDAEFSPEPLSAGRRLMIALVDAASRAHAADLAEAQTMGRLARAVRTGPAYVIAMLIDSDRSEWVPAYFHSLVRALHRAERLVALEQISTAALLTALSDAVRDQTADTRTWDRLRYELARTATLPTAV